MTKTRTIDKRQDTPTTFEMLHDGDAFTSEGGSVVFVKTVTMYDGDNAPYNTISLDGEFYWSDDGEEVTPVQELEVTIMK